MINVNRSYPLEWLDLLITITLNPSKTDVGAITYEQLESIISRLPEETQDLITFLKSTVFSINKKREIKLLIKQYYSSLIALLDQITYNQKAVSSKYTGLKRVYKSLVTSIDELLSFIETRFSDSLSLEEQVPVTYLAVTRKELKKKLEKLRESFTVDLEHYPSIDLVLKRLYYFCDTTSFHYKITFRAILYKKELVRGLEKLHWDERSYTYSELDKLLIYLNFNSKAYMNLLTYNLAQQINNCESAFEKMDKLLFFYKAFNQLHRKPDIVLNPKYHDLQTVLSNWFIQEISYLEKKLKFSVLPLQGKTEVSKSKEKPTTERIKVMCALSSDQTGLILRAADELRILIAKSMNEVFKTIVPHISTPYRDDLSYDGMRSKSYVAEERDKQIAIEALESIIKKIRDY